jgi:Terminase large subunit, T4likevirus-type, N-terminal
MREISIDKVMSDPRLLGAQLGDLATWQTWLAILKAAFVLPLTPEEREVFDAIAGGRPLPRKRLRELWVIAGRRSGKSRMAALLAVYFALFVKHRLSSGERGMVLVLAASLEQARVVFEYTLAFLQNSPTLAKEVASSTQSEIRLRNGIIIAVHANSFRSVRGRTLVACIFDETAFWRDDTTATPDTSVYTAVLPALVTTQGMLIGISSPYRRMGLMYSKHKKYFGVDDGDTLVVQGATRTFNRTIDEAAITAQMEADPEAGKSEWEAQFRADIATFIDDEVLDACVDRSRPLELPPVVGRFYRAFVDPSGGAAGGDAYSIGIAHREGAHYIVDVVRGRQGPFDPVELTKEYAALCAQYRIKSVTGDKYAMEWVPSAWRNCGIVYTHSTLTASEIYLEGLPLFTRALASLPDHPVLLRELRLLERTPARLKREQVTHARGVHDDCANACFGALVTLASHLGAYSDLLGKAFSLGDEPPSEPTYQQREAEKRRQELLERYGQPVRPFVPGRQ